MTPSQFKGKLFEIFVRSVLLNCGFKTVQPDGLYLYEDSGLFYLNGKGARHDADVLLEPPFQLPFYYPVRLLFECKAYTGKVGLPVIRNALGLRQDLNEFEIVKTTDILSRKKKHRTQLAIENRKRYIYQVGVASLSGFTKDAIEFAVNNKIPLFSLDQIANDEFINSFGPDGGTPLKPEFQSKKNELENLVVGKETTVNDLINFASTNSPYTFKFQSILKPFETFIEELYVGVLESGDIIFLYPPERTNDILKESTKQEFNAKIHYKREHLDVWTLQIDFENKKYDYDFFLPDQIVDDWCQSHYDEVAGIEIKATYFKNIIVFNKSRLDGNPFRIIKLDQEWLDNINRPKQGE